MSVPAPAGASTGDGRHLLPRLAASVYGVELDEDGSADDDATRTRRAALREERLATGRPTADWWALERDRVLIRDIPAHAQVMYAESMKLSPRWAAEFRGFWDLPGDFEFDVPTPTVTILLGTLTLLIEESRHTQLVHIGGSQFVDFVHFGYFAAVFTAPRHHNGYSF